MASEVAWSLNALAWSAFGLVAGYALARLGCEVHELREAVVGGRQPGPLVPMRRSGDRRNFLLGVIVVGLAVVTMLTSIAGLVRQESVVACQARYGEQIVDALEARSDAAARDRRALNRLVTEIALARETVPPDGSRVTAALASYRRTLEETDRERALNPLPDPPRETCE